MATLFFRFLSLPAPGAFPSRLGAPDKKKRKTPLPHRLRLPVVLY